MSVEILTKAIEEHGSAVREFKSKTEQRLDDLAHKFAEADAMLADLCQKSAGGFAPGRPQVKTLGAAAVGSEQFQALVSGNAKSAAITLPLATKNVITGDVGSPAAPGDVLSPASRSAGIVPGSERQLTILDLLPIVSASSNAVSVTREASFTNAAAGQAAEGELKAESALTFELLTRNVITIAHWLGASKQVLADAPGLERYINSRLVYGLRLKLEQQLHQLFARQQRHGARLDQKGDRGAGAEQLPGERAHPASFRLAENRADEGHRRRQLRARPGRRLGVCRWRHAAEHLVGPGADEREHDRGLVPGR